MFAANVKDFDFKIPTNKCKSYNKNASIECINQ